MLRLAVTLALTPALSPEERENRRSCLVDLQVAVAIFSRREDPTELGCRAFLS